MIHKNNTKYTGAKVTKITAVLIIVIIAMGVWWWIWLNPYSFNFSETTLDIDPEAEHRVFAFGTLTNPFVRSLVIRAYVPTVPAELEGYRRHRLDLLPDDDAVTQGRIFYVTAAQLRRLDRYERVGVRYERYLYYLADGKPAWVYRRISEINPAIDAADKE